MKRTLSLVLSVIICLSMYTPAFAATNEHKGYESAYIEILEEYQERIKNYTYFPYDSEEYSQPLSGGIVSFADITGDSVPELFFICQNNEYSWNGDLMIWTYDDNQATLLLNVESFECQVAAGTRYCIFQSSNGDLIIHDSIGDESWWDYYKRYEYKSGQLILKDKLTIEAGHYYNSETDSTYTTGKYIFSAQFEVNGSSLDYSYEQCADLLERYTSNAKQIILSNYWSDEHQYYSYKAMKWCDDSFGNECWGGNEPKLVKTYNYQEADDYLSYNEANNEDMIEFAQELWMKQYNLIWTYPAGAWFEKDWSSTIEHEGNPWCPVADTEVSNMDDVQDYWTTYFTDYFASPSWYLQGYKTINGKLYSIAGGIGGDMTLVSFDFVEITEQTWNEITFLVREVRDDYLGTTQEGNTYSKDFYYTIVFEDNNWKCSEAVYTDGTPFIERFGGASDMKVQEVDFGDNIKVDLNWGWELFNKNASEYDHNLAMAGLLLSRATYDGSNTVSSRMKQLGFDVFHSSMYTEGFHFTGDIIHQPARTIGAQQIEINGEKKIIIVVAVRGTTNFVEWLTNASACVTGFLDAATNTKNDILDCLGRIESKYNCQLTKDNTIFFLTGHSQGAAVSGLLSYELLEYADRENIFTYTFASPNYYTVDNCESYKNNHNIIVLGDAVPTVPWLKKRYGNDWFYDLETTKSELNKVYGEDPVWNTLFYHDMKTYLACLLSGVPKNMGDGVESFYNLSSIHCPVDITVIDENGVEMGYTTASQVTLSENSNVLIYTDGESKYVLSPTDKEYTIRFTATGDGAMTFSQSTVDTVSRSTIDEQKFSDVKLSNGQTMVAEIGGNRLPNDIKLYVQDENGNKVTEILADGSKDESSDSTWIYLLVIGVVIVGGLITVVLLFAKKHKATSAKGQPARDDFNKQNIKQPVDEPEEKFCSKCGTPFAEGGLFCAKCGNARKTIHK